MKTNNYETQFGSFTSICLQKSQNLSVCRVSYATCPMDAEVAVLLTLPDLLESCQAADIIIIFASTHWRKNNQSQLCNFSEMCAYLLSIQHKGE